MMLGDSKTAKKLQWLHNRAFYTEKKPKQETKKCTNEYLKHCVHRYHWYSICSFWPEKMVVE